MATNITPARARQIFKSISLILHNANPNDDGILYGNTSSFTNILTFLRGPDSDNQKLKEYTTSRVRAIVGFWSGIIRTTPLNDSERDERDTLLSEAEYHFQQHWTFAVDAVKRFYQYDLQTETAIKKGKNNGA